MLPAGFEPAIPTSERVNLSLIPRGHWNWQFYLETNNKFLTAIVRISTIVNGETPVGGSVNYIPVKSTLVPSQERPIYLLYTKLPSLSYREHSCVHDKEKILTYFL
jgi:hypothetical protein